MKQIAACLPFVLFSFSIIAQSLQSISESGGAYPLVENDAEHPCITDSEYALLEQRCNQNAEMLGLAVSGPENVMTTALNWPLQAANGLNDCNFYGISAYVDQNTTAGAFSDYNCGSKTYDAHRGTDISIWPFPFYKMDNNQVQVIAAAAGTIVDKSDGNFDKNCAANNLTANYIVVQHADGSRVLYFHMKKNSLTTKIVGQTVAQGEFLGIVGSSGNSSGPHLHFEVWSGSTVATRVDPYAGPCNSLNASSWWAVQKPYASHEILKTSVHSTDALLPACPETETPNEPGCFSIPFQGPGLPAGAAKFYIFMRYETAGTTADLKILNPDGSVFNSWTYTSTASYSASLKSWTKTLPTAAGTYTFQSSVNGVTCSKTFSIINPTVTASGPTSFCQGNSVVLTAGAGSTYLWSNGATTQSITVSNSGNYTVTVTSTAGCSAVSSATTVTVSPPPVASITPDGVTTFCQGGTVVLAATTGSTYLWSNGATTQNITVSISGNYKVTVTNAGGCSAVSSATAVTVNPLPVATVTPGGATTFCQGGSVLLSAPAGNTYLWSNGATTQNITVSTSGSYKVTVTNAGGCSAVSSATAVTVNPLPAATVIPGGATTFCQGGSVLLSAPAGNTYLWSNGATTQNITVSTSGSYKVTVTNAGACSAVSSATTVTVNPLPVATVTPGGATTFCQGGSVLLSAPAGNTYLWSTGAATQNITVSTSGSYVVTVTNAGGCSAVSSATAVTVNPLPVATVTPGGATTFCQGGSVLLSAPAGNTYLWSTGVATQNITVSTSGSYVVTVTNAGGCSAVSSATAVTVSPLPAATVTPEGVTTFCQGGSVILSAPAGNTYLWSNGATTQNITVSASGNYKVTITNSGGCSAVSTGSQVTVLPLPPVPLITTNGTQLQSSAPTGNQWFFNGSIILGANAQIYMATQSGIYSVLVTDNNGCVAASTDFNFMITGVSEISSDGNYIIAPNPNNGQFMIKRVDGNLQIPNIVIEIYNLLGQKVMQCKVENSAQIIDMSDQPDGIYISMIIAQTGKQILKISKD